MFFFEWRKKILFKEFKGLFVGGEEEQEAEDEFTIENKQGEVDTSFNRWSWFALVEKLAQGDPLKFEQIYELNWIFALNTLAFWKERDKWQAAQQKQQTQRYK